MNLTPPPSKEKIKDAVWAAELHFKTNTILADKSVRDICEVLPLLYEALRVNGRHTFTPNCGTCLTLGEFVVEDTNQLANCQTGQVK